MLDLTYGSVRVYRFAIHIPTDWDSNPEKTVTQQSHTEDRFRCVHPFGYIYRRDRLMLDLRGRVYDAPRDFLLSVRQVSYLCILISDPVTF